MKASQIQVGGNYVARVSGRLVTVRVDGIREVAKYRRTNYSGQSETRLATVYDVTNLSTGRKLTFRSAAKFRSRVLGTVIVKVPANEVEPREVPYHFQEN